MILKFNNNDISILRSIMDKETNRGLSKAKGTTIEQISKKTNLSVPKVRSTVKKFKDEGWIDEAIKVVNSKSYYVTQKGIDELKNLSKSVL